ncbi:fimbrial biogenesis outer membrane usher protein [Pseudoxanthomonas winnipegensis]|uniref:fimbria/pilus outer membrane usher protein n=1 Tax=Pseudoxanthomonas winnipegensis TaxID=2480810 RepID=UPI00102D8D1C|nr:fimbria/pilus outer membrane usher protein [Pseudoxanthomonas winnipegensis]TAA39370.1 fimbrial biogenesis outer membrane usher protein [Pseudoxanthomonas winnipegensis]
MKPRSVHCRSCRPPAEGCSAALARVALLALLIAPPVAAFDLAPPPAAPMADPRYDQVLYLQVSLNQTDTGKIERFELRRGRLHGSVQTLRAIGFRLDGRAPEDVLALDALPEVAVRYEPEVQRLFFDAPLSALKLDTTVLAPEQEPAPQATSSPGALLNYDLYANRTADQTNLAATVELRAFGIGQGVLSNTSVIRLYEGQGTHGWRVEPTRLDTHWQLDLPDRALTLQLGDFYSDALDWTRSIRMAGVQLGRNYGLQPYRVPPPPPPAFLGDAAVPSQVELYVDGLRQYSGQVAAGPFQLSTLPGINGTGNAQVVVTDAFGQVRTLDFSFYGTQELLAKGLSEGGVGVGVLREDYGLRSFRYGNTVVGTGTFRYGVSDGFTVEGHAEHGGNISNAGAGGLWLLGGAGVLSASYARSRRGDEAGGQTAIEHTWNNGTFNLAIGTQRTHGRYRDIGSLQGSIPVSASDHAIFGVSLPRFGSLSASYVRLRNEDEPSLRYAGLFWSQTFGEDWSANLSVNQNLDDASDRSLYLSASLALDGLRRASVSTQRNGNLNTQVVEASRAVPGDGGPNGLGWRVQARSGTDGTGGLAELGWQNDVGRYGLGAASQGGTTYGYASASGSLAWLGGGVLAARSVDNAFGVVSTGRPHIPVRLENRLIGQTNADGLLLVTPLQPWQRNRVSIDILDLPADLRVDEVERVVTPRAGAGLKVPFAITQVRTATLVLRHPAGQPLAVGSTVTPVGAKEPVAVVGHDGETYLDNLQLRNRLRIGAESGTCVVDFDYPARIASARIPRIGPLTCAPETRQ